MKEENTLSVDPAVGASEQTAELTAPPKPKRHINQQKLQDNLWGWAFCVPLIVGTVLFVYIALVMAAIISFGDYSFDNSGGMSVWQYIGQLLSGKAKGYEGDPLYWYKFAFMENERAPGGWGLKPGNGSGVLWVSGEEYLGVRMNSLGATLFNTVFYMIGIPIGMVLSMFFAVCMSRDIKGGNVFRVLYYIPCVASTVAIVYTFKLLFKSDGLINRMFGSSLPWIPVAGGQDELGLNGTVNTFWTQGIVSKLVIIIMSVWKGLGGTIILYVAGLSGVNAATKEAASIDGASSWTSFWKVTMPDLYPTIFYNIVTAVIGGMQIYAEPELIFGDGQSVNIFTAGYVSLIWYHAIYRREYSTGAAYGMILAIIIFVLTLFQFWLDSKNKD